LDVGAYSTKLVELINGEIKKVASDSTPVGLISDGEITSMDAMAEFLSDMIKNNGISRSKCAVVLPASLVYSQSITVPAMSEQQLKYSLPFEFRDYLADDKGKYFFDYSVQKIIEDDDGKPTDMKLFTCAVERSVISGYRTMLKHAGLNLQLAAPAPCAYSALLKYHFSRVEDAKKGCCIIDFGHTSTTLYMFEGENANTQRTLSICGEDIVRTVADSMHIDEYMATNYVSSNYKNILSSDACMQLYNSVAVEVMKAVNFYNFNNRDSSLEQIYICGGGSWINKFMETLESVVNISVAELKDIMPKCLDESAELGAYAKAIGIALQK